MKQNKNLEELRMELADLQRNNFRLSAHYTPVYDGENKKWYILMHSPSSNYGNDCDDAKTEIVAYQKAIMWMKREMR